jgi:two-component system, OmpR family, response regulator
MTRILIVDDADDIRFVASYALGAMAGMEVFAASNAEDGVRLAAAERPDCILLDLVMPGTDGDATLALLRADPQTRDIPVIFLTSRVRADDVARRHADQVAGVIAKPFDVNRLADQVREILARDQRSTNSH